MYFWGESNGGNEMVSGGEMAVSAPHDAAGNADKRNNTSFVGG